MFTGFGLSKNRLAALMESPAALAASGTASVESEDRAAVTCPALVLGGIAVYHGVRRHVSGHNRTGAHQRVLADRTTAEDGRIRSDAGAAPHERREKVAGRIARKGASGSVDVRKHHRRPAKHVVFQRDALIDGNVVLDLDVVADHHVGTDHHVLADAAFPADADVPQHVAEMPNGIKQVGSMCLSYTPIKITVH